MLLDLGYTFSIPYTGGVGDGADADNLDDNVFSIAADNGLRERNISDDALTATYVGGAGGMYVTRKLRLVDQVVDPRSPGYTGRFTATATLTANFGTHSDFYGKDMMNGGDDDTHNTIGGTITNFLDGTGTDLGFKVTLNRAAIGAGEVGIIADMTTHPTVAEFDETPNSTTAKGRGTWSGQFYGPSAADIVDGNKDSLGYRCQYNPKWLCWRVQCQFHLYGCCRRIRGGKTIIN